MLWEGGFWPPAVPKKVKDAGDTEMTDGGGGGGGGGGAVAVKVKTTGAATASRKTGRPPAMGA